MKKIIVTFICALATVAPSFGAEPQDRVQAKKDYCACNTALEAAKEAEAASCAWCDGTVKANALASTIRQAAFCVTNQVTGDYQDLDWNKYSEWCPTKVAKVKALWRACEPVAEKYHCTSGDQKSFLHKNLSKVKL
jgi:hypothetical protein